MANKMGILVGGGPAPGINSVIAAVTLRSAQAGVPTLGICQGFEWIMQGDTGHVLPLEPASIGQLHFQGGSLIGTSRANPTESADLIDAAAKSLDRLGISHLVTIGGDDTAFSAMKLAERTAGHLPVVHVPKTIDNDLNLPAHVDTFGFQTARHIGVEAVKNLLVDATTTQRWCLVITMGRGAGYLALGIGKAAGATLTLIPEEFRGGTVPLGLLVDTVVGSVIKRASEGCNDGVAVIAEGVQLCIDPNESALGQVERDAHGNVRLAEVDFSDLLKRAVVARLRGLGIQTPVSAKDIGYELRCAAPIPWDMEYSRDLGFCAAEYVLGGGHSAMVSMQGGHFVPVGFADLLNPETGRARTRAVNLDSAGYAIARRYMSRLEREDFTDDAKTSALASAARLPAGDFRRQFQHVVDFAAGPREGWLSTVSPLDRPA